MTLPSLRRHPPLRPVATAMAALLPAATAWAHDGHGLPAPHAHATDAWGFVVLGVLIALALWGGRR